MIFGGDYYPEHWDKSEWKAHVQIPAITVNNYGKGRVWYVGCDLEEDAILKLVKMVSDEADAQYINHPNGAEIIRRMVGSREYTMLFNHTANRIDMGVTGKSLLDGKEFNGILDGYSVDVIYE